MNAQDLIAFEEEIASEFNAGKIRAPVHLYSGCEDQMIQVFKDVLEDDWICCSWRSHLQCLLKGVPRDELKAAIMAGQSISLCFPKQRVISSAIVGGIIPIAVGIAMGIKHSGGTNRVFCWMGDMTALTGIAHECFMYAHNFDLPIIFVVEDNGKSVCTDTKEAWGLKTPIDLHIHQSSKIWRYSYETKWPHAGAGQRVQF